MGSTHDEAYSNRGGSEVCRIQRAIKNLQRAIQNSL